MKAGVALMLVGLAACDPPPAKAPPSVVIHLAPTRFVLPNGLEVFVQEDHRAERVAINLTYHVGFKDDPEGRSGLAHLVEHLQFSGSEHTSTDAFFPRMNDLGADDMNGTTWLDQTQYYETVPSASLDGALWLEADRMASAPHGWKPALIEREKKIVGQEIRLRWRNEPNGYRYQLVSRAVYPAGHPYRRSLEEEEQESASTPEELRVFAASYYSPDNATLLLVGDVTPERAREVVTRHFAAIEPCVGCRQRRPVPPVERAALRRMEVVADVDAPAVYVAWSLPPPGADGFFEAPFALAELEGNADSYTENPEGNRNGGRHTMRPGTVGWWEPTGGRLGMLGVISGTPTADGRPQDLVDGIELARTHILAYEWEHLSALRSSTIVEEIREIESLGSRARRMQEYLEDFGDPGYVTSALQATQAVTGSRVRAVIDHLFDLDRAAVVVVTPDASAPRSGRVVSEVKW